MIRLIVILIAVLAMTVVILPVGSAQAETCNFNVSSGNWTDGGNWSCGHEPTFADLAVILSGNTCTMDDAAGEADSLTVESTATLNVQANKKLTLDSSDTNSTIAGTVNLQGSGSELAFINNNQTIDGAGKIVGQHSGAQILLGGGVHLTNQITIEGALSINDGNVFDATFINLGT
ncbi:MAG: hypothetical protein IH988_12015, partial [Planctomycetes bacterium]|nr:hypothetical protein [Planctomycetota bacterium]